MGKAQSATENLSSGPAYILWILLLAVLICLIGGFALPMGRIGAKLLPISAYAGLLALLVHSLIKMPFQNEEDLRVINKTLNPSGASVTGVRVIPHIVYYVAWLFAILGTIFTSFEFNRILKRPRKVKKQKKKKNQSRFLD